MTPKSQTLQNMLSLIATSLALGLTFFCPAAGTHYTRKEFIGHGDPRGYRCRFTLSKDWQSEDDRDLRHGSVDGQIDEYTLFPKDWTHGSIYEPPEIDLQTFGKELMPGDVSLVHGYPEPNGRGKARLITHRQG